MSAEFKTDRYVPCDVCGHLCCEIEEDPLHMTAPLPSDCNDCAYVRSVDRENIEILDANPAGLPGLP